MLLNKVRQRTGRQQIGSQYRSPFQVLHLDPWLLIGILLLVGAGLLILYSASDANMAMIKRQFANIGVAATIMVILAQIPPSRLQRYAPYIFVVTIFLLVAVLLIGHIGKGAQRWLGAGPVRFQPSEFAQVAVVLMLAWIYERVRLPLTTKILLISGIVILIPFLLIAKEPDLGTAIMTAVAGAFVILLAGLRWRWLLGFFIVLAIATPVLWHFFMHEYQKLRILTFLNPERDPLGAGYHIIQSKIAIGSGGITGNGWLQATQAKLNFLPEHTTDFIFAVCAQEFGILGCLLLIGLYMFVVCRGLYISLAAQDTFTRLIGGSLSLTFFMSFFVNIGMVTGIIPVVGIPLPLISYGGTSMVTLMASIGILMSIKTHRKLITT